MSFINENFFDSTKTKRKDINEPTHKSYTNGDFAIILTGCFLTKTPEKTFNAIFRILNKRLKKVLKWSPFNDRFPIDINDSSGSTTSEAEWKEPKIENTNYYFFKESGIYDGKDVSLYDISLHVRVHFNDLFNMTYNEFSDFMMAISETVMQFAGRHYRPSVMFQEYKDGEYQTFLTSGTVKPYLWYKFIREHYASHYENDSSYKYENGVNGGYDLHYNGGVKLSEKSSFKIDEIGQGEILYSTMDGELVTDRTTDGFINTPIGMCVCDSDMTGDGSCRFCSLCLMSWATPDKGTIGHGADIGIGTLYQSINLSPLKNGNQSLNDKTSRYDKLSGEKNTEYMLGIINQQSHEENVLNGPLTNPLNMIPANCVWRFHTEGTRQGDWYLPSYHELLIMNSTNNSTSETCDADGTRLELINILKKRVRNLFGFEDFSFANKDIVSSSVKTDYMDNSNLKFVKMNGEFTKGTEQKAIAFLKVY